jgi:lipopolysaccharide/colanic/teichoic acid biosynthesis glycosyltransferase
MSNLYVAQPKDFKDFHRELPWFNLNTCTNQLFMNVEDFEIVINRECERSNRFQQSFSLVTFKIVEHNVTSEHLLEALSRRLRISDVAGWLNNEYVGVLLFNTSSRQDASCFIENVHQMLSQQGVSLPEHHVHLYPHEWHGDEYHLNLKTHPSSQEISGASNTQVIDLNESKVKLANIPSFTHLFPTGMPWWKRAIDIIGGICGLLVLSPLFAIVAIYIKAVSPGPVFFRQPRAGYLGKSFIIWKFRTMKVNANVSEHQKYISELLKNGKPMYKLEDVDPQIILHGNALRKTGIDELPQLINVLCGEMSLVGPRPDVFYAIKNYKSWYHARSDAYPGLTGLWQVSGKNNVSYEEMMCLDIKYARNISFWLDIKILFLTPLTVLQQVIARLKTRKQKRH